jgi:hypothetical protein
MSTIVDFRSYANYPLGIRNNNPGNIRPGDNWVGMIGTNKNFVVFKDIHHGLRALAVDLANKINKGYNTLAKIIARYAPPSENDTAAYIKAASYTSGFGADEPLTANNDTLKRLMRAIVVHENGSIANDVISDSDIQTGISMIPQTIMDRVKDFFTNNPNVTAAVGHVKNNGIMYAIIAVIVVVSVVLLSKYKKNG